MQFCAALILCATSACHQPKRAELKVGLGNLVPIGYRDETGKPAGFGVDALNEAARREGIVLNWRPAGDIAANDLALGRGELDLIIGAGTPARQRNFYVSEPWWSSELVALTLAASPVRRDSDLYGRRIATPASAAALIADHYRTKSVIVRQSAPAAAQAVCTGEADAAILATMFIRELLFAGTAGCRDLSVRIVDASARLDYALIARRDVAGTAAGLRRRLDEITADGTLAAIAARHPPISTPQATRMAESLRMAYERRLWIVGIVSAAGVMVLGLVSLRRQRRSRLNLRVLNAQLERDLLARTVAEAALRNSETRFRALLDSAPQTVLAIDSAGAIAFANAKVEHMFGYRREDLLGASPDMLIADLLENSTGRRFSSAAASQTGPSPFVSAQFPARRKNGTEFPIEVTFGHVEANENLTLAFITDVSERAALEEQLRQSQKLESVGQLAGGVAHDFNNLLTVIAGYAQMALGELPARSVLRDSLEQIARAADRAADLTRQLLLFSRRRMVAPKLVKVNELIQQTEKMLRRLIGENIELILALDARDETVRADPGHIEQVIVNLSVNARDAMPQGGRLVIATGNMDLDAQSSNHRVGLAPGSHLVLRISDTGHGMTPEVKARIFEPFFTTKGPGKGTGLGLSTVYGIIKQTGGAIFVTSEPGSGSVFEIFLPVTEAASDHDAPRLPPAKPVAGSETILVAEDENTVRTLIKSVLEAHGYTVLVAAQGNEALEIASEYQGPIHLLLTDVIMPEMGGVDLAARFSQLHPDAAIAQMSGYADHELRVGATGPFIEKPFTPAALLHRVQEILRTGKTPS